MRGWGGSRLALAAGLAAGALAALPPPGVDAAVQDTLPTFRHAQHRSVACASCHVMTPAHGLPLVRTAEDCRSCHHAPSMEDCGACHAGAERREPLHVLERTFTLTVHEEPSLRDLPFRHDVHEELECVGCHTGGPSLSVPDLDCTSCHEEHHEVSSSCASCHQAPGDEAHEQAAHLTCSGAGCHLDVPVEGSPRTREGCLWCHGEMADHEPGRECVRCHLLPPPRSGDDGR